MTEKGRPCARFLETLDLFTRKAKPVLDEAVERAGRRTVLGTALRLRCVGLRPALAGMNRKPLAGGRPHLRVPSAGGEGAGRDARRTPAGSCSRQPRG